MSKPRVRWEVGRGVWLMTYWDRLGKGGLSMEIACRRWQDAIAAALRVHG